MNLADPLTKNAISATLHCLTGCAIGEILGMAIGTAFGWTNLSSIVLAVVLAFFFGYLLSIYGIVKAGVSAAAAVKLAIIADTLSITSMEIVDNAVLWIIPGALDAELNSWFFWLSLMLSLLVAFIITVPLNRWLISKGKGHAAVHHIHHGRKHN